MVKTVLFRRFKKKKKVGGRLDPQVAGHEMLAGWLWGIQNDPKDPARLLSVVTRRLC